MRVRQRRVAAPIKPIPSRTRLPGSGTGDAVTVKVEVSGDDLHWKLPKVVVKTVSVNTTSPEIGPIGETRS